MAPIDGGHFVGGVCRHGASRRRRPQRVADGGEGGGGRSPTAAPTSVLARIAALDDKAHAGGVIVPQAVGGFSPVGAHTGDGNDVQVLGWNGAR